MATERYRLTVSGIVTYSSEDFSIRDFLLSDDDAKTKLSEAIQEIEEESTDQTVVLERIS